MSVITLGPGLDPVLPCQLPHSPQAPALARHHARTALGGCHLGTEALDDVLLVVSELVTNAVQHALPPVMLRLSHGGASGRATVHVEVTDSGPAAEASREGDGPPVGETGRGNAIVAALSTRYGTHARADRVTRWADLEVPGPGDRTRGRARSNT